MDATRVIEVARGALERHGAPAAAAQAQAVHLVEGDLRGRPSHGVQRLPTLIARIVNGVLVPDADPELTWTTECVLTAHGHDGFGPPTAFAVLGQLLDRVGTTGIAIGAIRSAGHLGMLAPYVEAAADAGAIGIALTTSEALVHPTGAGRAMVGTNPIAIGVPASPHPFILDMSTAAISAGEVIAHEQRGMKLPEGVAVDALGRPTTDPTSARAGAVSPFGGSKGYGLALGFELLVASLTATALGPRVKGTLDTDHPATKGDLLIVLSPDAFGGGSPFELVSAYLEELRSLPPAPDTAGVSIPGDRARTVRGESSARGLRLPSKLWDELVLLAGESRSEVTA